MIIIGLILLAAIIIEIKFSPRLGYTREGKILLWYKAGYTRKYIVLL